jgi:hypothetical protein
MSEQEELEKTTREREQKYVWKSKFSDKSLAEETQKYLVKVATEQGKVTGKVASHQKVAPDN